MHTYDLYIDVKEKYDIYVAFTVCNTILERANFSNCDPTILIAYNMKTIITSTLSY